MPFACNTPGGQVQLLDLPLEALDRIEEETGRRWSQVLSLPAFSAKSIITVYREACAVAGCEPEPLTPRKCIDGDGLFVQVPDDMPDMYEGGLPKAEADQPTSGSSGAPDDSGGPQQ